MNHVSRYISSKFTSHSHSFLTMIGNYHSIMKIIIILAAFTALSSAAQWTDLRVKWSGTDLFRLNSFFKIPRDSKTAFIEGWVSVPGVNDHPVTVYCFKDDGRFCILTDSFGNIAGFQVGAPANDVENQKIPYKPSTIPAYKKKTLFGEDFWTVTVYTVDPDVIDAGGRSDAEGLTGTTGIWIEEGDSYMAISRNLDTMLKTLDFHEENCVAKMGTHYYYAMNESLVCEEFQPIFLLYDKENDLHGIGFQVFGQGSKVSRNWYEWVPSLFIRPTIPNAPQCLVDWTSKYSLISMHVYFIEKPWKISC